MEQLDKVQSGLVECIEREVIMNEAIIAHELKVSACMHVLHTNTHTLTHTHTHTIHTNIHTYIHTYIHTCMHTYIHTYIHTCSYTFIHVYNYIHIP